MMMTVMMAAAADGRRQILNIGELPGLRGSAEVGRKLVKLVRSGGITLRLGRLNGALQVRGDLLCHLLILSWVGLLKLLKLAQQLRERRKLGAVWLDLNGRSVDAI